MKSLPGFVPVHLTRDPRVNAAHRIKWVTDGVAASTATRVNNKTLAGAFKQSGTPVESASVVSGVFYAFAGEASYQNLFFEATAGKDDRKNAFVGENIMASPPGPLFRFPFTRTAVDLPEPSTFPS